MQVTSNGTVPRKNRYPPLNNIYIDGSIGFPWDNADQLEQELKENIQDIVNKM